MTRYARQVDANQTAVVEALRRVSFVGAHGVQHLHTVGGGCPDLLVGQILREPLILPAGSAYLQLLEIKDGRKPPSARALTEAEAIWLQRRRGWPAFVVTSPVDALRVVTSPLDALKAIGVG